MAFVTLDKQKTNKYRSLIPFIESEFPEQVRLLSGGVDVDPATKQSLLIEFIRRYYDWLETDEGAQNRFNNLELFFDVNYGISNFFIQYKKQFLTSLPGDFAVSSSRTDYTTSLVIKNARSIYRSKGTEASLKFLFRFLYQDEAKVSYPKKYFERELEDFNFPDPCIRFLRSELIEGDASNLPTRMIYGTVSNASAVVERIDLGLLQGIEFYELRLSKVLGNFTVDERVETRDSRFPTTAFEVTGLIIGATISNSGSGYTAPTRIPFLNDRRQYISYDGTVYYNSSVDYSGALVGITTWNGSLQWNGSTQFNANLSTNNISNLLLWNGSVLWNGSRKFNTIVNSLYDWDGTIVWDGAHNWGSEAPLIITGIGAIVNIDQVTSTGGIFKLRIIEPGIRYRDPPTADLTGLGDGLGDVKFGVGTIFYREAEFLSFNGDYSLFQPQPRIVVDTEYKTIHGSSFSTAPEEFTYFIESATPVFQYADMLQHNFHPAGMKYVGILNYIVYQADATAKMFKDDQPEGVNATDLTGGSSSRFIQLILDEINVIQEKLKVVEYFEIESAVRFNLERVGEVQLLQDFCSFQEYNGSNFYNNAIDYSSALIASYQIDTTARNTSLQFDSWTLPQFRKYTSGKVYLEALTT